MSAALAPLTPRTLVTTRSGLDVAIAACLRLVGARHAGSLFAAFAPCAPGTGFGAAPHLDAAASARLALGLSEDALAGAGALSCTDPADTVFALAAGAADTATAVIAAAFSLAGDAPFAESPGVVGTGSDAATVARLGHARLAGPAAPFDGVEMATCRRITTVGGALIGVVAHRRFPDAAPLGALVADGAQISVGARALGDCGGAGAALGHALNSHAGNARRGAGWDGGRIDEAVSFHASHLTVAQIRIVVECAVGVVDTGAGLNRCASACALGADIVVGALVAVLAGLAMQRGVHAGRFGGTVGHNAALARGRADQGGAHALAIGAPVFQATQVVV